MSTAQARKARALRIRPVGSDTLPNGARDAHVTSKRNMWALRLLQNAGARGVSRWEHRSTSLPHYVFKLREALGETAIRTEMEPHGGEFPGEHARYFLAIPLDVREADPPPKRKPRAGSDGASKSGKLAGKADAIGTNPSRPQSQASASRGEAPDADA